jgi:hypothetical protein
MVFSFAKRDDTIAEPWREWEHSMDKVHERPIVTEANKEAVRAGHTGDHLRYVLIASCALVVIGFVLVAMFVK